MADVVASLTPAPTRTRRAELLARAGADELRDVASRCIAALGEPVIVAPAETGVIVHEAREPIVGDRFQLGEVVVTSAEVHLAEHAGWSLRMGTDRAAALAAAVCDAAAEAGGDPAADVAELLADVEARLRHEERLLLAQLGPTIVEFEELD